MERQVVEGEFQDWELLSNVDSAGLVNSSNISVENSIDGIQSDSDSGGMIRSDYFSLNNQERYAKTVQDCDVSVEGSVESDNPSWIDPGLENRYGGKSLGEFWSDSASDRSDERKLSDVDAKTESVLSEVAKSQAGFGEMSAGSENLEILGKGDLGFAESAKKKLGFEEFGGIQSSDKDLEKFWSDFGGDELVSVKFGDVVKESEMGGLGDLARENESSVERGDGDSVENQKLLIEKVKSDAKSGVEEEKRRVVWWKVPLDLLKYCLFKVSPVWSFSVAAALMGFVILGRKLYKMKRMNQSLQLKVTVDDKKVSEFMGRAARLNEAFSVVKRVPIVRPLLPAAGVNPWPVMSMR